MNIILYFLMLLHLHYLYLMCLQYFFNVIDNVTILIRLLYDVINVLRSLPILNRDDKSDLRKNYLVALCRMLL